MRDAPAHSRTNKFGTMLDTLEFCARAQDHGDVRDEKECAMPINVETIDHVNVESDDVDRSRDFYHNVIGLKEGPRPEFDRPGYWMYAGDKPVVHIIKTDPKNKMLTGSKDASISHFALQIKNYRATRNHLERKGIKYVTNDVSGTKIRQLFLEDPEGVLIELIYLPKGARV